MRSEIEKKTYNNATVIEQGDMVYLQSYNTIVCGYDTNTKKFYKFWDDYSRTTQKHIKLFCDMYGINRNVYLKKEWESIPVSTADVDTKKLNYRTAHHVSPIWGYIPYGYQRNLY